MTRTPPLVPFSCVPFRWSDASASADTLLVEGEQAPFAVIGALEGAVGVAVVAPVKVVLGVERRGIQRLLPVQLRDLVLDEAVVVVVRPAFRQRNGAPEPEVHVHRTRLQRVEGPDTLVAQPQRTHPYRAHSHIFLEKSQELGTTFDWDLHVLDDELSWREVAPCVEDVGEAVAPVEADELAVHVAAPVTARPQAPDQRFLHTEGPRA